VSREERILKRLRDIGEWISKEIAEGRRPYLRLRERSTSNIVYDEESGEYVIADSFAERSAKHMNQIRAFANTVRIAMFVAELIRRGKTATLRETYYQGEAYGVFFKDQQESNERIMDLETLLDVPREDFHIFPEERSFVYGPLEVEVTEGHETKRLRLDVIEDGIAIGPKLTTARFIKESLKEKHNGRYDIERVIAIESGGMFSRLIEERAHERFNAILIHLGGQAPRATRRFIKRLNEELGLPVYIFTDGDPRGMHIAMVIKYGSAHAAHVPGLATPKAIRMGVRATDIQEYKLPSDKLSEIDKKRLKDLRKDPRYQHKFYQDQISTRLKIGRKAEQQSFARYGLAYVINYLERKFRLLEEMREENRLPP